MLFSYSILNSIPSHKKIDIKFAKERGGNEDKQMSGTNLVG